MIEFNTKGSASGFLSFLFRTVGIAGLFFAVFAALGAPTLTAIFTVLMWIGGVLFFGIAILIGGSSTRLASPALPVFVAKTPRPDGLNEEYEGIPFMRLESGHIVAAFENGKFTFESWDKFVKAAAGTT